MNHQVAKNLTADMIFDVAAMKFGAFKLKLHEKNPEAPLSPYFFNLRTPDNPKPGHAGKKECELIAHCLYYLIHSNELDFSAIAGVPNAGDPFVEALASIISEPHGFRIIKLAKEEKEGKRRIIPAPGFNYRKGERVLLVDDLITKADSKLEAIEAIESSGAIVKDVVVLIDRQQGGRKELEVKGYHLYSVFTVRALLTYYRNCEKISAEQYTKCLAYLSAEA